MINIKTPEEKAFLSIYSDKVGDRAVQSIIAKLAVSGSEEALRLSHFFWDMVDAVIEDEKIGLGVPWRYGAEILTEKVMYALSGYLGGAGFEREWAQVFALRCWKS